MKLVTFNIRCDFGQDGENCFCRRRDLIAAKIRREQPDIICFQEVLPHVAVWLKENLKGYYVIGCGRDENLEDEQVSVAYRRDRVNLISMDTFWLSDEPYVPGSRYACQSICPRVCTGAVFSYSGGPGKAYLFRLYNIHLDHMGGEARRLGLELILKRADREPAFQNIPRDPGRGFQRGTGQPGACSPEKPQGIYKRYGGNRCHLSRIRAGGYAGAD